MWFSRTLKRNFTLPQTLLKTDGRIVLSSDFALKIFIESTVVVYNFSFKCPHRKKLQGVERLRRRGWEVVWFGEFTSVDQLDLYRLSDDTTLSEQREDGLRNRWCAAAGALPPQQDYRAWRSQRRGICKLLTMHCSLSTMHCRLFTPYLVVNDWLHFDNKCFQFPKIVERFPSFLVSD